MTIIRSTRRQQGQGQAPTPTPQTQYRPGNNAGATPRTTIRRGDGSVASAVPGGNYGEAEGTEGSEPVDNGDGAAGTADGAIDGAIDGSIDGSPDGSEAGADNPQ